MSDRGRAGFTLFEVIATILLVSAGFAAVIGMSRLGVRWSGEAIASATGLATARTVLADARPGGRTADLNDVDGDGWGLESGSLTIPAAGAYSFTTFGFLNGYYVRRVETSTWDDLISGHQRHASVEVDVFWGSDGRYVTGIKQRIIRSY